MKSDIKLWLDWEDGCRGSWHGNENKWVVIVSGFRFPSIRDQNCNLWHKGYFGQFWKIKDLKELLMCGRINGIILFGETEVMKIYVKDFRWDWDLINREGGGVCKKIWMLNKRNCWCQSLWMPMYSVFLFASGIFSVQRWEIEDGNRRCNEQNILVSIEMDKQGQAGHSSNYLERGNSLRFDDCCHSKGINKKQGHAGIFLIDSDIGFWMEGYLGNYEIFWFFIVFSDNCGREDKRKNFKKSENLRIWIKGYFGQVWGKYKMEDKFVNCLGMIENWRKELVSGNLMSEFFEKQMKIEIGSGWCDIQWVLDSTEINNKQGQFGHFSKFVESWCWNDYNGGWMVLQSGWNNISRNQIQDINSNGLNFTWNQKPQGSSGI